MAIKRVDAAALLFKLLLTDAVASFKEIQKDATASTRDMLGGKNTSTENIFLKFQREIVYKLRLF